METYTVPAFLNDLVTLVINILQVKKNGLINYNIINLSKVTQ